MILKIVIKLQTYNWVSKSDEISGLGGVPA